MDDRRFDNLVRALFGIGSRRAALRFLTAVAGGLLGQRRAVPAAAGCVNPGQSCGERDRCCDGRWKGGGCTCAGGRVACDDECCPAGMGCEDRKRCCVPKGAACASRRDNCCGGICTGEGRCGDQRCGGGCFSNADCCFDTTCDLTRPFNNKPGTCTSLV